MHIEVFVEEESVEEALKILLPRIMAPDPPGFRIHPFNGKPDMMRKLPQRLRGLANSFPDIYRVLVLLDEDRQDCHDLKRGLEGVATRAGLVTKSAAARGQTAQVLNRIVVEELEAWFFGDVDALCAAYPRVPPTLAARAPYRDPDAIRGGTWEALEQVLQAAGYYGAGLPKIEVAKAISQHMDPSRNRSRSFQVFRDGLLDLIGTS